ncbi:hypothetical protein K469DRAFT_763229 [Zopfia rhizophila CBS 207.26]|uniref:Uncharacterized protein n=1 Tax=Zopfia rhizophila CBS 207.26 TaxID=1314779 RepID=A0A6A6DC03_9PEZI|nr:hypothetical protein K469DRAFT_763229 [Zopfia rhizophila CBS 207.26]
MWLETSKQTLFCPGIPGAGKTILISIVIDHLITLPQDNPKIGVAYLYCNFRRRHEQKAEDLLASLLKQLCQEQSSLPHSVKALYDRHKDKRTQPSFEEFSRALASVAALYSRVFIVIDALDECQVSDGDRTRFLSAIFKLQTKTAANLFVTSRFIPEIIQKFDGSPSLEIRASDEDLRRYLEGHMSQLPSFVSRNVDLQGEIKTEIIKAVDGMFLLAQLHIGTLIGKRSPKAIRIALKNLPTGSEAYDHAYKEAMERIEGQVADSRDLAKQLSWITCAKRRLTILELRHALAVEIGASELDEENLPEIEDMVSVCAGLVTVDEESDIIRLVHYTIQEYFERTWGSWFPTAQRDITMRCVTYLSFNAFSTDFCLTDEEFNARLRVNILYDYASRNWGYHAQAASTDVEQLILNFLQSKAKVSASSQAMMAFGGYYSQRVPSHITGVHLAAYFGLEEIIMALLKKGHYPDVKDSSGRTPLSWAAENGHEVVVKLLLATERVDLDSKDKDGQTPLWRAAEKGHEAVVELLLARRDVDVNSKDVSGITPLWWAAALDATAPERHQR